RFLTEYAVVKCLIRHRENRAHRQVILFDSLTGSRHTQFAYFIVAIKGLPILIPFIAIMYAPCQRRWDSPTIVTSAERLQFIAGAPHDDNPSIVCKRHII